MTLPAVATPPPLSESDVIQLHEVSKWYGDVIGLNQVSMGIAPGVTGLLGPNGAGKSTMMRLLTGQIRPKSGTVSIFGENPWRNSQIFRRVGFCPDTDSFYEDQTGLEFVTLMGRLADYSSDESARRAKVQLERVHMSDHMNRRVKGYSKGMRQRTKLAAAMLHDPEVLILDEPLNGLDPVGRIQMLNLFRELGAAGKTVLVSSHILHEIETLTRRIALIHRGRVLAEGRIEEVRALIENQPLTLSIVADKPRRIGARLAEAESVVSMEFDNKESVTVRSHRPDDVFQVVQAGVVAGEYEIKNLIALDENLDAIFQYLVNE